MGPVIMVAACTLNGDLGAMTGGVDGGAEMDGAVGPSSGVPRSVRLMELGGAQASVLCDWANLRQGGYGRIVTCPAGGVGSTSASKLDCVNRTSALGGQCVAATVGDIEDCANEIGSELCQYATAPACQSLVNCTK